MKKRLMRQVLCMFLALLIPCYICMGDAHAANEAKKAAKERSEATRAAESVNVLTDQLEAMKKNLDASWSQKGPLAYQGTQEFLDSCSADYQKILQSLEENGISDEILRDKLIEACERFKAAYTAVDQLANKVRINYEIRTHATWSYTLPNGFIVAWWENRLVLVDSASNPLYEVEEAEEEKGVEIDLEAPLYLHKLIERIGYIAFGPAFELDYAWLEASQALADQLRATGHTYLVGFYEWFCAIRYHLTWHLMDGELLAGLIALPDRLSMHGSIAISGGACTSIWRLIPWLGQQLGKLVSFTELFQGSVMLAATYALALGPAIIIAGTDEDGVSIVRGWNRMTGQELFPEGWRKMPANWGEHAMERRAYGMLGDSSTREDVDATQHHIHESVSIFWIDNNANACISDTTIDVSWLIFTTVFEYWLIK